ncbi:NAD(P)H-dependent oxidoreductase [Achromobacter sp. F4_2707]|uniref:FMN-dependent NADH-azoreductase n=1 Tax=Achromobacter sp. F4_2707 TaxID=3114286 RepID=UPI0039C73881
MKLLHVDSSINGAASVSRGLTRQVVEQWLAGHPDTEVEYLDLAVDTPTHFSADALGIRRPNSDNISEAEQRENALSETLVSQFLAADVIVVGAPLYNFSIPSQLKAWIDRLAQAGRTFRYTENGPEGLATGKTVIAVLSRGGVYSTSEAGQAMEHQESYLKTVFGFFGITDIRIVRAEGTDLGADSRESALRNAAEEISALTEAVAA